MVYYMIYKVSIMERFIKKLHGELGCVFYKIPTERLCYDTVCVQFRDTRRAKALLAGLNN